jgi:hypothetical protein
MLKNICNGDQFARDLIDEAVRNPAHVHPDVSIRHIKRPAGTTRDRALRQLRDHRPDLHARVIAKKLSPHAAMIEAGFRVRTFTVPDDIDAAIDTLIRRFGQPALIRALQRKGVHGNPPGD